ncbi:MAG: serine hydrolase [Actinomycetales bacterium]|nr:serine hydrolase [Actinomycetales bacterium]
MRRSTTIIGAAAMASLMMAPIPAMADDPPPAMGNPSAWSFTPVTQANIDAAVAALPGIVADVRARTGVPGIAVAVVHDGQVVMTQGFGERYAGSGLPVDADTVFQMASVSKPVGATVVSRAIAKGIASWNDPITDYLPWFALESPYVSSHVTIGDMYAHRSGLPGHAGDDLEDIGFGRAEILKRLRYLPLRSFRDTYAYTNFGLTAAGEAVATAAGTTWADLADTLLFQPAGMTRSSFRFGDYLARQNKALTNQQVDGVWRPGETRNPQAQSPAGGLSSTANDMARWLMLQLGNGTLDGQELIPADILQIMRQPHSVSGPATQPDARSGFYGYGIGTGVDSTGHVVWSHSGAFFLGAGTVVNLLPAADLGIAVLGNGTPTGQVEAIAASFMDIATTGRVQRDWLTGYESVLSPQFTDQSVLAGKQPPVGARPAAPLSAYTGGYRNDYVGTADVIRRRDGLALVLGPAGRRTAFPLTAWGGDLFSYQPTGENALGPSAVRFDRKAGTVTIEQLNEYGQGVLTRTG